MSGVRRSRRLLEKSGCVEIFVRNLVGKIVVVWVSLDLSVRVLKELVQNQTAIPPDDQRLIFCGRQLDNDQTIRSYGIQQQSTLHLVCRLRGD